MIKTHDRKGIVDYFKELGMEIRTTHCNNWYNDMICYPVVDFHGCVHLYEIAHVKNDKLYKLNREVERFDDRGSYWLTNLDKIKPKTTSKMATTARIAINVISVNLFLTVIFLKKTASFSDGKVLLSVEVVSKDVSIGVLAVNSISLLMIDLRYSLNFSILDCAIKPLKIILIKLERYG